MLTKTASSITLREGYYGNTVISTDPSQQPAKIEYSLGHKHSGNSTNGGGCYTKIVPHQTAGHADWYEQSGGDRRADGVESRTCPYCGRRVGNGWGNGGGDSIVWYWQCDGKSTYYTYEVNCGLPEGTITRKTTDISTKKDNESIISALITY